MNPPLPKRLGKKTETTGIDGNSLTYTVVDEEAFLAKSNPNKTFRVH